MKRCATEMERWRDSAMNAERRAGWHGRERSHGFDELAEPDNTR